MRAAFLLLLAAGCAPDATPEPPEPAQPIRPLAPEAEPSAAAPGADSLDVPTVFDRAEVVFDTLEPEPARRVEIPEPAPPPRPQPTPRSTPEPEPPPLPPPAPAPPVAGSCDVRESESFCFAYTGATWSTEAAEANCAEAPGSTFSVRECPAEGRIATCVFRRGEAPARQIVYTYYAPYDLGLARLACPGRFTEVE